jgi:hypothetical protein
MKRSEHPDFVPAKPNDKGIIGTDTDGIPVVSDDRFYGDLETIAGRPLSVLEREVTAEASAKGMCLRNIAEVICGEARTTAYFSVHYRVDQGMWFWNGEPGSAAMISFVSECTGRRIADLHRMAYDAGDMSQAEYVRIAGLMYEDGQITVEEYERTKSH